MEFSGFKDLNERFRLGLDLAISQGSITYKDTDTTDFTTLERTSDDYDGSSVGVFARYIVEQFDIEGALSRDHTSYNSGDSLDTTSTSLKLSYYPADNMLFSISHEVKKDDDETDMDDTLSISYRKTGTPLTIGVSLSRDNDSNRGVVMSLAYHFGERESLISSSRKYR